MTDQSHRGINIHATLRHSSLRPMDKKATYNPNYEEKIRLVEDYKNMRFKIMADQKTWLFGFDRTSYSNLKNNGRRRWRWYEEMREQSK
jgi:hypothetical protein